MFAPSGENVAHETQSLWPWSTRNRQPRVAHQTMAVKSRELVKTLSPRGEKQADVMAYWWPDSFRSRSPEATLHNFAEESSEVSTVA
eukprot:CAMPEP_0170308048 /NCGR_PEP_ID=MMETSP0116_2-20130129/54455_1 /TAXON_ID=400756 /ORGANISM="Durinskia baltica, Strain CSIRO CS-38" /LENGTH=86 /DNA_ID=CAMNT_0010560213 /DNA_START=8 /DNA_END=264 /DNA_ORIENTATION=+